MQRKHFVKCIWLMYKLEKGDVIFMIMLFQVYIIQKEIVVTFLNELVEVVKQLLMSGSKDC